MARRGMNAQQIVSHYLPGAKLAGTKTAALEVKTSAAFSIFHFPFVIFHWFERISEPSYLFGQRMKNEEWRMTSVPVQRSKIASEHFRLSYPANLEKREVEEVLRILEIAQNDLAQRLHAASVNLTQTPMTEVTLHHSTGDFVTITGQPAWVAGATRGRTIHLQPLPTLRKRGILQTTLRHELTHAALERLSHNRTPRWLSEGLAIHFAGEGRFYPKTSEKIATNELETKLAAPSSPAEMRILYATAYRAVQTLMQAQGEAKVWQKATKP
jgi:hypothetical protein